MKFLLASIGTRGDVQPLLALALELRALSHTPIICAAPNFQPWIVSFGIDFAPIGPDLEAWTRAKPAPSISTGRHQSNGDNLRATLWLSSFASCPRRRAAVT